MSIAIQKPYAISESTHKDQYTETIYPSNDSLSSKDRLFLVCDGSPDKKDLLAGALACDSIQSYFNSFLDNQQEFEAGFIEKAIRFAEIQMEEHQKNNPDMAGMSSQLGLVYIANDGVYISHIGENRIVQIRDEQIIFQTEPETKRLKGISQPVRVDVVKVQDVQPGDLFFVCSGCFTEALKDETIRDMMHSKEPVERKLTKIKEACLYHTSGDFSAFLIPIVDVKKELTMKDRLNSIIYSFI